MHKEPRELRVAVAELEKRGITLSLTGREEGSVRNAKIIAASDEMLSTLELMEGYFDSLFEEGVLDDESALMRNKCKKAIQLAKD